MTTQTEAEDTFHLMCELCALADNDDEDVGVEARDCGHVICEECWEDSGGCAICEQEEMEIVNAA